MYAHMYVCMYVGRYVRIKDLSRGLVNRGTLVARMAETLR